MFQSHNTLDKSKCKSLTSSEQDLDVKKEKITKQGKQDSNFLAPGTRSEAPIIPYGYSKIVGSSSRREDCKSIESEVACVGRMQSLANGFNVNPSHFRHETKGKMEERYEFMDKIGKGGYGVVMKVKNKITQEIRAVKICVKSKCQVTKDFSDEITILQKLVFFMLDMMIRIIQMLSDITSFIRTMRITI
jgi:transcriptional regulator CtsR